MSTAPTFQSPAPTGFPHALPTQPVAPAAPRIAITSSLKPAASTSFGRQMLVELRKLVDTVTGKVLLAVGLGLTLVSMVVSVLVATWVQGQADMPAGAMKIDPTSMIGSASQSMTMFVAILGILSITGEWTQRTTLTTFALEPRRGRVLAAKVLVMIAVTTAILLASIPLAYACVAVAKAAGATVSWGLSGKILAAYWGASMLGLAMGLAFGLLTMSSAGAIVIYFALPMVLGLLTSLGGLWTPLSKVMPWIDPNSAMAPLVSPDLAGPMTGMGWWHLLVGTLLWAVIPFTLGTWRWMRREVK